MKATINTRVSPDGVLRMELPLGAAEADKEVHVTVESIKTKPTMTQAEWAAWVESMAGSIKDPTFRRHEQGEFEKRGELP